MASITKRDEGYSVRWRDPDGRERRRQAPSLRAARQLVRAVEEAAALGKRWEPEGTSHIPTVDEVVDAYLADRLRIWKASTHHVRAVELVGFVEWMGADLPVGRIHRESVAAWWAHLTGRGVSTSTANGRVRLVCGLWAWAYDHDDYGPHIGRPRRIDLPTVDLKHVQPPTLAHVDAMLMVAASSRAAVHHRRSMVIQRYTGLRAGQARRLDWSDIDMDALTIRIRPELGKTRQERRGRVVPLHPSLRDELAGWGVREGLVCDGPPIHKATPIQWWERSGAPEAVWRSRPTHCIRKAVAAHLIRAGVQPHVVSYLLGHSEGTTLDVYAGERFELAREALTHLPAIETDCVQGVADRRRLAIATKVQ